VLHRYRLWPKIRYKTYFDWKATVNCLDGETCDGGQEPAIHGQIIKHKARKSHFRRPCLPLLPFAHWNERYPFFLYYLPAVMFDESSMEATSLMSRYPRKMTKYTRMNRGAWPRFRPVSPRTRIPNGPSTYNIKMTVYWVFFSLTLFVSAVTRLKPATESVDEIPEDEKSQRSKMKAHDALCKRRNA